SHRLQDPDWVGHVMEHLDGHDEVVVAVDGRVSGVTQLEPRAIGHAGLDRGALRGRDGRVVEVVAVHLGVRVRAGDRDRGEALTTAHLGDPYGRTRIQLLLNI